MRGFFSGLHLATGGTAGSTAVVELWAEQLAKAPRYLLYCLFIFHRGTYKRGPWTILCAVYDARATPV